MIHSLIIFFSFLCGPECCFLSLGFFYSILSYLITSTTFLLMKFRSLILLIILILPPWSMSRAQSSFINLTPLPKQMTLQSGTFVLPTAFAVGGDHLSKEVKAEIRKFIDNYNKAATGSVATSSDRLSGAAIGLIQDASLLSTFGQEGYRLTVTPQGAKIEAATPTGFFYALTSINKMLPSCVAAGVRDAVVTRYELPCVTITDSPRFAYRGFMLDVARHFFSVEEIKRMLDVMAIYKLNKFHFHLTEDQGWRWEVKKYPRLTTVGAIAPNTYVTSMRYGAYWTNQPYGPYFYTRQQLKDIVSYAADRHIEVIPEIDMPGHFSAAMAAYPEYSCDPAGAHRVECSGGVFTDVLNVANPKAVRFVKDILDELMEIFPSENIHIGGDECPTTAWERNKQCQDMYKRLKLTSYRQLQTHFINEIYEYLKAKGRKISVWNETVTEKGADLQLMKKTGATVYCWVPARRGAEIANSLGLPSVYTVYGPYYINRAPSKQGWMATLPGNGSDDLRATYNEQPTAFSHSIGVQGTFWTEHVATADVMEHLALPRLIAVAEAGWSPAAKKNFNSFVQRMQADTVMLNYNKYEYGRAYLRPEPTTKIVYPRVSTSDAETYYRIVTRATDEQRKGRCITLLASTSPLIARYSAQGAAVGRLWTAPQAAEGTADVDAQLWRFEQDAAHPNRFALVCKTSPAGSVSATPTATSVAGRWNYDPTTKHYDFILGDKGYGVADGYRYYTIRSAAHNGLWFNASMPGQGLAVNLYSDPAGGNGGLWHLVGGEKVKEHEIPEVAMPTVLPQNGTVYLLRNTVEGFASTSLSDAGKGTLLMHTTTIDNSNNAWEAADVSAFNQHGGTLTLRLRNAVTGRFVGAPSATKSDKYAFPVNLSASGATVTATYHPLTQDYTLSVGGKSFFPIAANSQTFPGIISSGSSVNSTDAVRPQGTGWQFVPARAVTFSCVDTKGNALGNVVRYVPVSESALVAPKFAGYRLETVLPTLDGTSAPVTITLRYKKTHHRVFLTAIDEHGALLAADTIAVPVGESLVLRAPAIPFYNVKDFPAEGLSFTPSEDTYRTLIYRTSALSGVTRVESPLTTLVDGMSVVLYDTSTKDPNRAGYRNVSPINGQILQGTISADGADPMFVWQLRKVGTQWQLYHPATGKYMPEMIHSGAIIVGKTPGSFTFTLNADGQTWRVLGTNGEYWDGQLGSMTGWHQYGHPYEVRSFRAAPYFRVTVRYVREGDEVNVLPADLFFVRAGQPFVLEAPEIDALMLKRVDGQPTGADGIAADAVVTCIYAQPSAIESLRISSPAVSRLFDLSGRPVSAAYDGVVIYKGGKRMQP